MNGEIDDEFDDDGCEETFLENGTYKTDSYIDRIILAWMITESWE